MPGWFPVDKFDIDVSERLIEYKKKLSEMYLDNTGVVKPRPYGPPGDTSKIHTFVDEGKITLDLFTCSFGV